MAVGEKASGADDHSGRLTYSAENGTSGGRFFIRTSEEDGHAMDDTCAVGEKLLHALVEQDVAAPGHVFDGERPMEQHALPP